MDTLNLASILALLWTALLVGCTQRQDSPEELREKAAQATAEAKRDTKAIAEGVREGWNRDKSVDLNNASKEQLMSLPGLSSNQADRIIDGRPYDQPEDLVRKRIIPKSEYDKIADRLTVKK